MITVRAMTEADDEIGSSIAAACYRFTAELDGLTEDQVGGAIREWCTPQYMAISRAKDIAIVAELDGEIVGLAATRADSLQEMFVDPRHHRKGIGRALFQSAERTVAESAHPRLRVKTTYSALPFYAAMGMHQVATFKPEAGAFVGKTMFVLEKAIGTHSGGRALPRQPAPGRTTARPNLPRSAACCSANTSSLNSAAAQAILSA